MKHSQYKKYILSIVLICFGIGMLVGNFVCVKLIDTYTSDAGVNWNPIWMMTTVFSALIMGAFCVLFKDDTKDASAKIETVVEADAE